VQRAPEASLSPTRELRLLLVSLCRLSAVCTGKMQLRQRGARAQPTFKRDVALQLPLEPV
jgi:hypothetical protein